MNIVIIMSGGVGKRFGSIVPKQYNLIMGIPVIDYVIDAVNDSKLCDKVVVVIDSQWISYSDKLKNSGFDYVQNGDTRIKSLKNGLDYIKENYDCSKIVIVDSVAPFIYGDLIDDYFNKLNDYGAVITAQNITGGFTDIYNTPLDREKYIITQSPEGFDFNLLYDNFDIDFPYQEMACMLPLNAKRFYNYEFKNNIKLTYDFELKYVEFLLKELGHNSNENNLTFFDKNILYTNGIKKFFLKRYPNEAEKFINNVYSSLKKMIIEYKITSFLPNQNSSYGLVVEANSEILGDIIIKFIPEFIGRYEREIESYSLLSKEFMCEMLKVCKDDYAIILRKIKNSKYAVFEDNIELTDFFDKVYKYALEYNSVKDKIKYITDYYLALKNKFDSIDKVPFCKKEIKNELNIAIDLYNDEFKNEKKYIIHLDIHNYNLLNDGKIMLAIDPNGVIAPLHFEFVRFIRNDIRTHKNFDILQRFKLLIHYFGKYVEEKKIIAAFIIDMALCNYNSTFENENDIETKDNVKLFNMAYDYLLSLKYCNE